MVQYNLGFLPEDIEKIIHFSEITASSDGKHAAYTLYYADPKSGNFRSSIAQIDLCSGKELSLKLQSDFNYKSPAYSPDGSKLAFLSDQSGVWQVWTIDLISGETSQLTTLRHGVNRYQWSPSGYQIALEASWRLEEEDLFLQEMSLDEYKRKLSVEPIFVQSLIYKLDACYGITDGSTPHICILNVCTRDLEILNFKGMPAGSPSWSPNGNQIVCYIYPHTGTMCLDGEIAIYTIKTGVTTQLTNAEHKPYTKLPPRFVGGGKFILYGALNGNDIYLYIIDMAMMQIQILAGNVSKISAGRTEHDFMTSSFIAEASDHIYFLTICAGNECMCRVPIDGGNIETVISGDYSIHNACISGETILCLRSDVQSAVDLYGYPLIGGDSFPLTNKNIWLKKRELGNLIPIDDETDIFLLYPPNQKAGICPPMVLYIQEDPSTCYTNSFWHEAQALASKGIAVLAYNPGSLGENWDEGFSEKLWRVLDLVLSKGLLDESRLGITSIGKGCGVMLQMLTSGRFQVAVGQRILCNKVTSYGNIEGDFMASSDIKMCNELINRSHNSPIMLVDKIKTPLLLLHGAKDYICSFEQSEQMFVAMKDRNPDVPVRLVMYPEENHAITRSGNLHNQVSHLKEMIAWFQKYLFEGDELNE